MQVEYPIFDDDDDDGDDDDGENDDCRLVEHSVSMYNWCSWCSTAVKEMQQKDKRNDSPFNWPGVNMPVER